MDDQPTRRCSACRQHLPQDAYAPSVWARGGYCRSCFCDYTRRYTANVKRTCATCSEPFTSWSNRSTPSPRLASGNCFSCYRAKIDAGVSRERQQKRHLKQPVAGERAQGRIWDELRAQVLAEESACWICNEPVDMSLTGTNRMAKSIDHVRPVALGGSHERDNLRLAHFGCNAKRGQAIAMDVIRELEQRLAELTAENEALRSRLGLFQFAA